MSRGVRDLRDLICVSRLTLRESDEEVFSDENNEISMIEKGQASLKDLTVGSPTSISIGSRVISPDSGFATVGSPSTTPSARIVSSSDNQVDNLFLSSTRDDHKEHLQPGTAQFKSQKRKKRKKSEKLPLEPSKHELPRPSALPPVQGISNHPVMTSDISEESQTVCENYANNVEHSKQSRVNFDDMMIYLDATIVANWLTRANTALQDMMVFCAKGDSFVQFSHFWLSEFPDPQKRDIFRMEYDILIDELTLAFAVGKENGNVTRRDILDLCGAILKEYPLKLVSAKGSHIFLNYLDTLTSEKQDQYKALLSDVRCSTSNRQFAQWLLAMRSFAVVNIWSSIINFFQSLTRNLQRNPVLELWSSNEKTPTRRMLQAIKLGFIEVIHYLIANNHVFPSHTDSHGRTLMFSAVMHNQLDIVKYFSKKFQTSIDINLAADTGNTPLHAASNSGNLSIVEVLCQCDSINVNCQNSQCENATPLHLAVMHGHVKIVDCLLRHHADPTLKMGTTSVYDLAKDFGHHEIEHILLNE